jgi:DegV family protein with EDD domain
MKPIKLITDSTCDLTENVLKERDIDVLPMHIHFGQDEYQDGVSLTVKEMYALVEKHGELPKSAAIAPGEFEIIFKKYLNLGYQIIYLGIGAKFSGTFQSAHLAKQLLESDDIHLIDSKNLSSGSGLLLLKASDLIKAGKTVEEIKTDIEEIVPKVRSQFVIDTLEYLYKGGRLNALGAFMGKMLHLHPMIRVVDGEMVVAKKISGAMRKAVKYMVNEAIKMADDIDPKYMMITHSMADKNAVYIRKMIDEHFEIEHVLETKAGCTISTHCGAGPIGILYIMK